MIGYSIPPPKTLGFTPPQFCSTLENRKKCGTNTCGRCIIGDTYVCKEGPVFTAAELAMLPMGSDY